MEATESFGFYDDLVEDDGVPILGIRAVMFLMPDGSTETRWWKDGDAWVGTALGLLDCVKHEIQHQDEDDG